MKGISRKDGGRWNEEEENEGKELKEQVKG